MVSMLRKSAFRIGLSACLVLIIAAVYLQFLLRKVDHRPLKPGGAARFDNPDTHGKVPGNPAKAERQMRKLYRAVKVFRSRHGGRFPATGIELINDIERRGAYQLELDALENRDCKYPDQAPLRAGSGRCFPYYISGRRPDGSQLGGDKPPGTKDVVAWTDLYFHWNFNHPPHKIGSMSPVGFYLVLWDDGQVARVPYEKVLFYPAGVNGWGFAFPGQAGVPGRTETFDQRNRYVRRRAPTPEPEGERNATAGFLAGRTGISPPAGPTGKLSSRERFQAKMRLECTPERIRAEAAKTETAFHILYNLIQSYKDKHAGHYPKSLAALRSDVAGHPSQYQQRWPVTKMSGMRYVDDPNLGTDPWEDKRVYIPRLRPDGTPLGGPKVAGTQEVLATRTLPAADPDDPTTMSTVTLWEDGRVTNEPYSRWVRVPFAPGKVRTGIVGQAGAPKPLADSGD